MEWQQITNIIILLFITVALVGAFSYMGTAKPQNTPDIDREILVAFGFTLLIAVGLFFANNLLTGSDPKTKFNLYMGMIYITIFMAYVSMGIVNYKS